jgi:type VI secretion system secreted protein Hcp
MGYATYLKLDGLVGDCAEEAHRGWVFVDSFNHTLSHDGRGGQVHLGEMSIAKCVDRATPLLARAAAEGRLFRQACLEFCQTEGARSKFMEIRLEGVRVTMHSLSGGSPGDTRTPFENASLGFEKIEWSYYPSAFEPKAGTAVEVRAGWDAPAALATA